jgi:outer membrane biosynthesis protein TonB
MVVLGAALGLSLTVPLLMANRLATMQAALVEQAVAEQHWLQQRYDRLVEHLIGMVEDGTINLDDELERLLSGPTADPPAPSLNPDPEPDPSPEPSPSPSPSPSPEPSPSPSPSPEPSPSPDPDPDPICDVLPQVCAQGPRFEGSFPLSRPSTSP